MNELLEFENVGQLENFFSYPNSVQELLQTGKNQPELYWKNRGENVPGLILFRSDNDAIYPSHTNEDLVVLSLVSYKGSKDYTGKGYAFAISKVMDGRIVSTSYRTTIVAALDLYSVFASEITRMRKFETWLKSFRLRKTEDEAMYVLVDGEKVAEDQKLEIWEMLFMFFRDEVQKYFEYYHTSNITVYEAKKYPLPNIMLYFAPAVEIVYVVLDFEKEVVETNIRNPIVTRVSNELFDAFCDAEKTSTADTNVVMLENGARLRLDYLEQEDIDSMEALWEVLAYEDEMEEMLKEMQCKIPKNCLDYATEETEISFWIDLLNNYAIYRTDDAEPSWAVTAALHDTIKEYVGDKAVQGPWSLVINPQKEDEI